MPVADFAPMLATLIGLGVGIDYALFIVTRHRKGLRGAPREEAAGTPSTPPAGPWSSPAPRSASHCSACWCCG